MHQIMECIDENASKTDCTEIEPVNEVAIGWQNLRYEVKQYGGIVRKKKPILRRVNGFFEYYSLSALMGPSGAGKTTLLNCLSANHRETNLTKESAIYLNKSDKCPISCFLVQQVHESIVARMTVRDILKYAFRFKNSPNDSDQMEEHIQRTLNELLLPRDILDRYFVDCSGGEQKRIAIGQELMSLHKPSFLFMDEPTSGLDSFAALEVMKCVKQLTLTNRISVIVSIHVPSSEILSLFDKLYVLSLGGLCIFSGKPNEIETTLKKQIEFDIPYEQPPVEALLKIACSGISDSNVQKLANQTLINEYFNINAKMPQLKIAPNGLPKTSKQFSIYDLCMQSIRLLNISFMSKAKQQIFLILFYVFYFSILVTFFGYNMASARGCYEFVFDQSDNSTCSKEQHLHEDAKVKMNQFYVAFVFMVLGFITMCTSVLVYSSIFKSFRNEHRNNWYSLGVFYWSASIVSFVELNIFAFLVSILSYFLSNQQAADYSLNWRRFGYYHLFIWLLCFYLQSIGQLIGILLVNYVIIAAVLCQAVYAMTMPLNGIYIKLERIGSGAIVQIADWSGMIQITRGLFYAIYGIDRCDPNKEFSWVLLEHNIEVELIRYYAVRVLINAFIFRILSLSYLYCKFVCFDFCRKINENLQVEFKMIPIDFDNSVNLLKDQNNNLNADNDSRFKSFSQDKIAIAWRNLCLSESNSLFECLPTNTLNKNNNRILRELHGQFYFGTFNALMGTSGAGKTSLLKVLNGRSKTRLSDSTHFYLSRFTKIKTCFITQDVSGHLMPGLTAKQTLVYASRLKNMNFKLNHDKNALNVLGEFNLLDTTNTKVEKCSGGERKRLAIAIELTAIEMPNLVLLDEPTSGLDSNSAEIVISCLKNLTRLRPITIIASIHQPNTCVLSMFDQLYVLARGGVCIYFGPPKEIQYRLSAIPSMKTNRAIEELIKHSCKAHNDEIVQKLVLLQNEKFFSSPKNQSDLSEQTQLISDGVIQNSPRFSIVSVYILALRFAAYVRGYRWKELLCVYISYIIYSFVLTLLYDHKMIYISGCLNLEDDFNNTCGKTEKQVEEEFLLADNLKYNHFYTNMYLFLLNFISSLDFIREFVYFQNEHRNGWYSSGSFYMIKCLYEIIPLIPLTIVIVYIVDLYETVVPISMFWPLVNLLLISAIGIQGMAHCISLLAFNNLTILTIIIVCSNLFLVLVGNFYIPISEIHYVYRLLSNFSIFKFAFEGVILLQYGFGRCGPKQISKVLYTMSLEDDYYYHIFMMLVFNLIFYRFIAIYLLITRVNPIVDRKNRTERISTHMENIQQVTDNVNYGLDSSTHNFSIRLIRC